MGFSIEYACLFEDRNGVTNAALLNPLEQLISQEDHEATTDGESNKEANLGDEMMPIALLVSKPGLEVNKYGSSLCTYPRGKKCLFFL